MEEGGKTAKNIHFQKHQNSRHVVLKFTLWGAKMSDTIAIDQEVKNAPEVNAKHIKSVTEAVNNVHNSGEASIFAAIKLGVALLEARQALGANLYEVIKSDIIHKKTMQRYIRMVTHRDCDDQLAKKPHFDDKINLKVDTRVVALLECSFPKFSIPSMGKITSMRHLSDENFKKVLDGDYKPLEESIKERNKLTQSGKFKTELEEKFKKLGLSDEESKAYVYESSNTALLNELHDVTSAVKKMSEERIPLEEKIIQLEHDLANALTEITRLKSMQEIRDKTLRETGAIKRRA